jgi:crossover junction endodeoxyribonuclease RusA
MQSLTLPLPPSLNRYYRSVGRMVLISKEGREFKEMVRHLVIEQQVMPFGVGARLWMHVLVERADLRRADLDNTLKALQDSMEGEAMKRGAKEIKAALWPGVYDNDGQIDLLVVERGVKSKQAKVIVSIGELQPLVPGAMLMAVRSVCEAANAPVLLAA